jgi:hypothetical protein
MVIFPAGPTSRALVGGNGPGDVIIGATAVAGGWIRLGAGPGSASAEDLAGNRRSEFQRYLIVLREWQLRQPGEDHRLPPRDGKYRNS